MKKVILFSIINVEYYFRYKNLSSCKFKIKNLKQYVKKKITYLSMSSHLIKLFFSSDDIKKNNLPLSINKKILF